MEGAASDDTRRLAWERRVEPPLLALAVLFLVVYAVPILGSDLPETLRRVCRSLGWTIWGIFAVDYAVRLLLSRHRAAFVRGSLLDLASVVLPVLRPLRALRILRVLGALDRRASAGLQGRVMVYLPGAVSLLVFVSALAILDAERDHPDANITSFHDAAWWAMTTITTVGYGDRFPVTGTGRLVATAIMIAGIAVLGVVTASVAAWFVQRVTAVTQAETATRVEVEALTEEIRALRSEIRREATGERPSAS